MIVVTGGAGFIGSNLVATLAAQGRPPAVCDRLGSEEKWRNLRNHEIADFVQPEDLFRWLARNEADVDAIVHLGAISSTVERNGDLVAATNIRFTLDLFAWCAERGRRLIYASSAATYGDGSAGFDDDASFEYLAQLRPLNLYGWSKHVVDRRVVRLASQNPRLRFWVALKFFNVYGPNEYHKGEMQSVVSKMWRQIADGKPVKLFKSYNDKYPDGGQTRDFIWVQDCVSVIKFFLDNPEKSGLFNVGTGDPRTFADLARATFAAGSFGEQIEYIEMPELLRDRYQYFTRASVDRLRNAGYDIPFTPMEKGVQQYVQKFLALEDPYG